MNNKLIKNVLWLFFDRVFVMVTTLGVGIYAARYFGPDNYGTICYATSITILFVVVATAGLEGVAVKEFAASDYNEDVIFSSCFIIRLFGGIILVLLASITARVIDANNSTLSTMVALMAFSYVLRASEVVDYYFQSKLNARLSVIARNTTILVISIVRILLLVSGCSIIMYAATSIAEGFLVGVLYFVLYKKHCKKRIVFIYSRRCLRYLLIQSWPLIVMGLYTMLYMRFGQIMIGIMLSQSDVAYYSIAVRMAEMWFFVPIAIINSWRVLISENYCKNNTLYDHYISQLYCVVIWLSVVFAIFVTIFGRTIVSVLYGNEYLAAAPMLSLASWTGIFAMLSTSRSAWLVCEQKNVLNMYFSLIGGVITLPLSYVLIRQQGAIGAVIATLIVQILIAFAIPLLFWRQTISYYYHLGKIPVQTKLLWKNIFCRVQSISKYYTDNSGDV